MSQSGSPPVSESDAALDALRLLARHPEFSQRQLAQALGLSLGKTHYVLHALLDRGLVKFENFKRNDKKLGYAYLLTPKGLSEKIRLSRGFLLRKEAEFEMLKTIIANLRKEVRHEKHKSTNSELDF
jgi:EPS-associated MarR family transcriptional regulator